MIYILHDLQDVFTLTRNKKCHLWNSTVLKPLHTTVPSLVACKLTQANELTANYFIALLAESCLNANQPALYRSFIIAQVSFPLL